MGSPGGQYWCQMLLEHLLCARLGWGQRLCPKQLVSQEVAGTVRFRESDMGSPISLRPLQAWGLLKGLSQSKRWGAKKLPYRCRDRSQGHSRTC